MGVMRRNLVLLGLVTVFLAVSPAFASVTVEQTTDAEYIMNQGYSQLVAEDAFMLKNRATGKPVEALYRHDNNLLIKSWKAIWGYIDPARDEFDRLHHDIKPSPSASDL